MADGVEALVLAAGLSRRMGAAKPFLPYGESTFIETVLARLAQAGFDDPVVVANATHRDSYARLSKPPLRLIINDQPEEGMFRSLRLGLRQVSRLAHHAMVCLADMPMVRGESYARLAAASHDHRGRIVIAGFNGREGHPVLWPRTLFGVIEHWSGSEGARGVIDAHEELVVRCDLPDPAVLADVDTPEEYRRLFDRPPPEGSDSGLA